MGPCSIYFTLWEAQTSHDAEHRETDAVENGPTESSSFSLSQRPQLAQPVSKLSVDFQILIIDVYEMGKIHCHKKTLQISIKKIFPFSLP